MTDAGPWQRPASRRAKKEQATGGFQPPWHGLFREHIFVITVTRSKDVELRKTFASQTFA